MGTFGVFLLFFMIIRFSHPAFELTPTPWMILLAFIILTLGIIVISIIVSKFNQQLEKMKSEQSGVHEADVGRLSATAVSFSLGISNMRKRRDRTILTCLTLIILTFTVLSFTSVRTFIQTNVVNQNYKPAYSGFMLRDRSWEKLSPQAYSYIKTELADKHTVIARAWYTSEDLRWKQQIDIMCNNKTYAINGLVGFMPEEKDFTNIDETLLPGSRWFDKTDDYCCIVPLAAAKILDIKQADLQNSYIKFADKKFKVIGIYDDAKVETVVDLDNESMMPVDYTSLPPDIFDFISKIREKRRAGDFTDEEDMPISEYSHLTAAQVIWLDYDSTMNMRGAIHSIAIKTNDKVENMIKDLIIRLSYNIYTGDTEKNKTNLYSSIGLTSFTGLGNLFIPILIAGLIVLNTMLGSVYERLREIGTFSAVGLAPVHISMLFLAEASVYATIGAITGYLLGQTVSKILLGLNLLGAMTLNYSSTSTVSTTIIIMVVVLLSTLYPAKKAAEISVPAVDRRWKLPESDTGEITVELPFTLNDKEALGCIGFLKEYFDSHVDFADSNFYNNEVKLWKKIIEQGSQYSIGMDVWLPPYDLGTSQNIELRAKPTTRHNIYEIDIILKHRSGDVSSWKRANRFFLQFLRKQFLIWRTVPNYKKEEYGKIICEIFEKEGKVNV